jgi:acetyl-CoA carboxylase carboxyl transferase subunit alpha
VIDEIIPEPLGGAHRDHRQTAMSLKACLIDNVRRLKNLSLDELVDLRYEKFRRIGVFEELEVETEVSETAES